jgi:hypothetical protein
VRHKRCYYLWSTSLIDIFGVVWVSLVAGCRNMTFIIVSRAAMGRLAGHADRKPRTYAKRRVSRGGIMMACPREMRYQQRREGLAENGRSQVSGVSRV